ncbi:MAG TPA: hypothetical protein VG889_09755 [Rhizomicrobium sp.]|nr:hypothetical protein [Rhizomicrobium sp.]
MTRVCFIGDSHTAAMRLGWETVAQDFPKIKIAFYAAHRVRWVDLAVEDGRLVPQSEELTRLMRRLVSEPVIAPDYDHYILCGMDYSIFYAMNRLMSFRSEDQLADNRTPLSSECYLRAMTGCLRDTINMQVARKVRAITARPITIVPGPRISDANDLKLYPRLEQTGDAARIAGYFAAACATLCSEIDAQVLEQPARTLRDPIRTLAVYAKDAPREFDEVPRPDGWKDYQHMNAEYGALALRDLFAMPGF